MRLVPRGIKKPSRPVSNPFEPPPDGRVRASIVVVLTDIVAAVVGLALLVYLAYALARPEKF